MLALINTIGQGMYQGADITSLPFRQDSAIDLVFWHSIALCTLTSFSITPILVLSPHSCLDISSGFSFCFPVNTLNASLCYLVRAKFSAHFFLFDINLINFALALCFFFQNFATSVSWCTYTPQHTAPEHLLSLYLSLEQI